MNCLVIPHFTLQYHFTSPNPPSRISTRKHRTPGYLKDYHCCLAVSAENLLSTIKSSNHPHDISKYVSYNKISARQNIFSVALSHTGHKHFLKQRNVWSGRIPWKLKFKPWNQTIQGLSFLCHTERYLYGVDVFIRSRTKPMEQWKI